MSELFYPNIALYLLQLLLIATFTFIVGNAFLYVTEKEALKEPQKNPFEYILKSYMWGYVVLITLFAIVWTKGNSIMWISLLLLVVYWIWHKNEKIEPPKINLFHLKYFCMSLLVFFAVFGVLYYVFFIRSGGAIECDDISYSNTCAYVSEHHVETIDVFSGSSRAKTYHWGELWFTTFCGTILPNQFVYTLLVVTNTFFFSLVVIGGSSIAKRYIPNTWLALLFGASLLIAVPFFTSLCYPFVEWANWMVPMVSFRKYAFIYVFILLFFLYYDKKDFSRVSIPILLLVPFYSTIAPFVLTFICVLSLLNLNKNEQNWLRSIITNRFILVTISVFVLYVLFYSLQKIIPENSIGQGNITPIITDNIIAIKSVIVMAIRFLEPILVVIPSFAIIWYLSKTIKTDYSQLVVVAIIALIVAALVAGMLWLFIPDGYQVVTNSYVFLTILCWYSVLLISKYMQGIKISLVVIFLIVYYLIIGGTHIKNKKNEFVISNSEIVSLATIKKDIVSNLEKRIGYYRCYDVEYDKNLNRRRLRVFYPLDEIVHFTPNGYAPICLSAIDIPENTNPRFNERHQSVLLNYMAAQPDSIPIDKQILNFIAEKNIGYFVVEKNAVLPDYLSGKIDSVAAFRGDVLYKLKPNSI